MKKQFLFTIYSLMLTAFCFGQTTVDLPINFDSTGVNYDIVDFGGNSSVIAMDPVAPANMICETTKSNTAQTWAGTTMGGAGLANPIPFAIGATVIKVRVYSPDAGITVRLKAEDPNDPTHSVETDATTLVANAWDTLTFNFANQANGTAAINYTYVYQKLSIFFNFGVDGATAGTKVYYSDDYMFVTPTLVLTQVDLPVNFDSTTVDYNLVDFGGNVSLIDVDPVMPGNMVCMVTKTNTAQLWAGTTFGGSGLATAIAFAPGATQMTMRVYSPDAGIPIRLKVEDPNDPTHSVETEAMTTMVNTWETLTFDFANQASGTAAINYAYVYQKSSAFFNFGTDGATAGTKTYYCDDIDFVTVIVPVLNLPVTFDDANLNYGLTDFGGNASNIEPDPTLATNMVCKVIKSNTAQLWAGTTIGGTAGFATSIPFAPGATMMTMRVYSPDSGIAIRLKAEDPNDPTHSVETDAFTTTTNTWETLTFDFANQASGTAAINYTYTYQKISMFFNFGVDGATAGTKTYYCDDINMVPVIVLQLNLPVTFEDATLNYGLTDFGGNASNIEPDPTLATNMVCKVIKSNTAQLWAGTTIGGTTGFANVIPFAPGSTTLNMRVYSPDAGIPIRLKAEDPNDPTHSVETEAITTAVNTWETLTFDFANQASGTAAINYSYIYQKLSMFFNFGTDGATAGTKTYYCDDIQFGSVLPTTVNVTFQVQNPDSTPVYVFGSWSNWSNFPGDPMTPAGNGTYTATLPITANANYEFLFVNGATPIIEALDSSMSCTNGNPTNTNRVLSIGSVDTSFCAVWQSCAICSVQVLIQVNLTVNFDSANVAYDLIDFGGNGSVITADPTNPSNMVCKTIKSNTAQLWAGTTIGGTSGFASPIPFAVGATYMHMSVYSPDAGIQIRLKAEDPLDPTKSVETEATTTVANAWETLQFNFANQASGTAAINFSYNYQKLSMFFNFGVDGATAGTKTYYADNIAFGNSTGINNISVGNIKINVSNEGVRIFSDKYPMVDQVEVYDLVGRNIYSSNQKMHTNTLLPIDLNVASLYLIKVVVDNQTLTFKGFINK